ncbi:MAG: stage V sporulation protein AD [Clostridia bacterium]|nr:stage V sporulation protein AD [Clostridia bacterium]
MTGQTIFFKNKPRVIAGYSIVGPKEAAGPLDPYFHKRLRKDDFGQKSYEKAECKLHMSAISGAIIAAGLAPKDVDVNIGGDLLNQIITSSFSARELDIPFVGMYSACSTFGQALIVGAALIDGGYISRAACSTSSHFSTAERQYRYPLELGTQMTPTSQWTVTGAGCTLLGKEGGNVCVESATVGKVVDFGVSDANNMGAAMAPAAAKTVLQHLKDTGRDVSYYDYIVTGDLGVYGSRLFLELLQSDGVNAAEKHKDCGEMIFDKKQRCPQGGSGAGCSSVVFNSYFLHQMRAGSVKRLLLVPTGALLSKLSSLQGETIPGIANAVSFAVEDVC